MAKDKKLQVNVDFTQYPELYEALETLVIEQDTDRSKFIRQLVRREITQSAENQSPPRMSKKNETAQVNRSPIAA
jgi:metal-responsive CopG/Arc/MetJ family transcriptional regulator